MNYERVKCPKCGSMDTRVEVYTDEKGAKKLNCYCGACRQTLKPKLKK